MTQQKVKANFKESRTKMKHFPLNRPTKSFRPSGENFMEVIRSFVFCQSMIVAVGMHHNRAIISNDPLTKYSSDYFFVGIQ